MNQDTLQDTLQDTPQDTPQDAPQDAPQDEEHVTAHVEQLLAALTGAMSRAQLQEVLRLGDRRHFADSYLRPALEAGLVEMTLPDKPTSRNQRYRRTAAGEALARQTKARDSSA